MRYEITEKQIKEAHLAACNEWKQKIESWFPDVFSKKLEVGKWYKYRNREDICICYAGHDSGYGLWSNRWNDKLVMSEGNRDYTPLTQEEVEERLTKELVRRGFIEGAKYKTISIKMETKITSTWRFYIKDNIITNNGWEVFNNGSWAEIITEEPIKEMSLKEIEQKLGYKIKITS